VAVGHRPSGERQQLQPHPPSYAAHGPGRHQQPAGGGPAQGQTAGGVWPKEGHHRLGARHEQRGRGRGRSGRQRTETGTPRPPAQPMRGGARR
jgi:hypothetical protein